MSKTEKITIVVLMFALSASVILFGVWEDKVTLYAPLLVLTYAALAAWALQGGKNRVRTLLAAFRGPPSDLHPLTSGGGFPPGGIPLLIFWFYSLILIPFAVLPYEAKISTLRFGAYLGTYWASANILSRFSHRKAIWTFLLTLLILTALYSLVQHKAAPNLLFGRERYTTYWEHGRLGGTYQCPNHIAHLFQMGLPFCLVFLFLPQFGWFWRIGCGYAFPLFLLLIYQTQSRAGILGTVAGLGVTGLLLILRKSRRAFFIALLVIPLLGAGALGGLWAGSSMFRHRMTPVVKFIDHVFSGAGIEAEFQDFRPQTWLDTIDMISHRPVLGFGPGNYGQVFPEYRTRFTGVRIETVHPHNEYLELLAEYGLIGGMLILWALISACVPLVRFVKTAEHPRHALPAAALLGALAGTAVHGFFDFELRNFPNALMLALLAGCAAAPLVRQRSETRTQKSTVRFLTSGLWLLTSVFLLLAAVWSLQVMSSAWIRMLGDRAYKAVESARQTAWAPAERLYQISAAIDPQNWQAHFGLGQIYRSIRYNEIHPEPKHQWALKEKTELLQAYRINSKKEEVVYALGCAELALGNRDAGLNDLRQAANYKRFNDFYWRKLGIELRKAGLYEEALNAFEYALRLDRSNKTVKRNIEWLKNREKK
jgi:O-antigen ligase